MHPKQNELVPVQFQHLLIDQGIQKKCGQKPEKKPEKTSNESSIHFAKTGNSTPNVWLGYVQLFPEHKNEWAFHSYHLVGQVWELTGDKVKSPERE